MNLDEWLVRGMSETKQWMNFITNHGRVFELTLKIHKNQILPLFSRLIGNYTKYNGHHQIKIQKLGLNPNDSLLQARLWEYFPESFFLIYTISSGYYHQAYREMRFLIDSWVQAYYIDRLYVEKSLKEKANCVELGLYGSKLIKKAFFKAEYGKKLANFYERLSKFVHGSKQELEKITQYDIPLMGTSVFYDKDRFNHCVKSVVELNDLLMVLVK